MGLGLLWLMNPAAGPIFLSAIVKSNLCVLTLLLLTWTTPFHELLQQLRRWSFPVIMLTTLALMYRYLPVLGEETRRMSRARASRTFSRKRWSSWGSLAEILGQLFMELPAGRSGSGHVRPGLEMSPALQIRNLCYDTSKRQARLGPDLFSVEEEECIGVSGPMVRKIHIAAPPQCLASRASSG